MSQEWEDFEEGDPELDEIFSWMWHQGTIVGDSYYWIGGYHIGNTTRNISLFTSSLPEYFGLNRYLWRASFTEGDLSTTFEVRSLSRSLLPDNVPTVVFGHLWGNLDRLYLVSGTQATESSWFIGPTNELDCNRNIGKANTGIWQYSLSLPQTSERWKLLEESGDTVGVLGASLSLQIPGKSTAFTLSGKLADEISVCYLEGIIIPGIDAGVGDTLLFDMEDEENFWSNKTSEASSVNLPYHGALVYASFGSDGILVALGSIRSTAEISNGNSQNYAGVAIYDIATSTWYSQATSGQVPAFCTGCIICGVSTGSRAETSEIYLIGWVVIDEVEHTKQTEIYVLSLPSFRWFKYDWIQLNNETIGSSCHLTPRTEILLFGGSPHRNHYTSNNGAGFQSIPSNINSKFGVFRYPFPGEIISLDNSKIKNVVSGRTKPETGFNSPEVEALFTNTSTTKSAPVPTSISPTSTAPTVDASSSAFSSHFGVPHMAGAIVGPVLATIVIIVAVLLWRRRSRKLAKGSNPKPEVTTYEGYPELRTFENALEAGGPGLLELEPELVYRRQSERGEMLGNLAPRFEMM